MLEEEDLFEEGQGEDEGVHSAPLRQCVGIEGLQQGLETKGKDSTNSKELRGAEEGYLLYDVYEHTKTHTHTHTHTHTQPRE